MQNRTYKILSAVCYIISFIILFFCIKKIHNFYLSVSAKIIFTLISCMLIYLAGFFLVKKLKFSKKVLKFNLILYFLVYTMTICSLTLFDELYGRQGLIIIEWDKNLLNNYLNYSFNIIPFYTIRLFTQGYIAGIVSLKNFSVNIIGNFFAFMPYGIFFPLIFKSMKKYYRFLIIMIFIVGLIEFLQFITMSGACDIDDLILNVLGASIIYFISKIKSINNFIHRIFLWE